MQWVSCILRSLAALILGLALFGAFLAMLVFNTASGKLLNADFYIGILRQEDAYNRIYDEVAEDPEVKAQLAELLGDIEVVNPDEAVALLREIAPPDYLQTQTEAALPQAAAYFNGETDPAAVYVDAAPALARVKPALTRYVERKIDAIPIVEPDPRISAFRPEEQFQRALEAAIRDLSAGRLPSVLPEVTFIPANFRGPAFDQFMTQLDSDTRTRLLSVGPGLRAAFVAGDTRQTFRLAGRGLTEPLIDQAISNLRANLEPDGRLDLVELAAENADEGPVEFRRNLAEARDSLSWLRRWGGGFFLGIVLLAAALQSLVFIPSLPNMLRWPGLTLFLTGGVVFIIARIAQSRLSSQLDAWFDAEQGLLADSPAAVSRLGEDLARNAAAQIVGGFSGPALALCLIGLAVFVASFLVGFVVKPKPSTRGSA